MNKPSLSIVIASYNEEKRLPPTLEKLFIFLDASKISYEIIIVNDGSRDSTKSIVEEMASKRKELKLLSHFPNHGRGASIREGVLSANGDLILETDADMSVDMEAIPRFIKYFEANKDISVLFGSRELRDSVILHHQPFLRVFLGKCFIYLSKFILWTWDINDFTLGFKMFRKAAAQDIFSKQYDNHFVAEAEIVLASRKLGWKFKELPISWTDNRDSRISPIRESFRSFKGLIQLRMRAFKGMYNK